MLTALRERALAAATLPPARPRIRLAIDAHVVGSIEPDDASLLAQRVPGLVLDARGLSLAANHATDVDARLAAMAQALADAGRLGKWRDEALPVLADDMEPVNESDAPERCARAVPIEAQSAAMSGDMASICNEERGCPGVTSGRGRFVHRFMMLGAIERAAIRVLGLRSVAVHLVGWCPDGRMWVQRRALDKPVDPGLLDTLAGGLVGLEHEPGGRRMEDLVEAMRREADEEAGIDTGLTMSRFGDAPLRIARPVHEGYMVEDLVGFEVTIDAGFSPFNRDGEVAGFDRLDADALLGRIGRGEFTLEASLLILECLRRDARAGCCASGGAPRTPPAGRG
ncbi:MAG: hypothetical protein M9951_04615 [Burkholderiaceae bacterium]|nr:hypothetical protein [Burkholderiaceae bacterium]